MNPAIRQQIERRFSRSAPLYDQYAGTQRLAAGELLREARRLGEALVEGPVLEIGCGTGLLSLGLADCFPRRELVFTDLSAAMVATCRARLAAATPRPRLSWQVLDGEAVQAEGQYALIVSGLALHWFQDLEATWQRLVRALRPGGWLLCSYQGDGSFPQWQAQCARLGLPCTANPLPAWPRLQQLLEHWPVATRFWQQEVAWRYPGARDFFRSLKRTGASTCLRGERLTPAQFRRLLREWDRSCPAGVEVTVQIHYAAVQRCP